jgi:polyisoprenoid-binding protein YceI
MGEYAGGGRGPTGFSRAARAALTAACLGVLFLPLSATAAPAPAAPVWSVDRAASRLSFRAVLAGQPIDGVFKSWDAEIAFDPQNLSASHAVISVNTASAITGQPSRDQVLPTGGWLWTRRFPKAQLVTHAIAQTGPNRYVASAALTIRGVSRPVNVPFTAIVGKGDTGRMQAVLTIDRNLFGIGQADGRSATIAGPTVVLTMHITAKKSR